MWKHLNLRQNVSASANIFQQQLDYCCVLQLDGVVVADCDSGEICVCEKLAVHPLPERHATGFRDSCKKLQHQFELVTLHRFGKELWNTVCYINLPYMYILVVEFFYIMTAEVDIVAINLYIIIIQCYFSPLKWEIKVLIKTLIKNIESVILNL